MNDPHLHDTHYNYPKRVELSNHKKFVGFPPNLKEFLSHRMKMDQNNNFHYFGSYLSMKKTIGNAPQFFIFIFLIFRCGYAGAKFQKNSSRNNFKRSPHKKCLILLYNSNNETVYSHIMCPFVLLR